MHRAKVFGRCEKKTGIAPVDRLIAEVMSRDVLHELPAIAVSHTWVRMPHPVVDQDLSNLAALEDGFTEKPENIEQLPCLISAHLIENEVKIIPADAAWIEHGSVRRLKEKATLSIADEVAQDCRRAGCMSSSKILANSIRGELDRPMLSANSRWPILQCRSNLLASLGMTINTTFQPPAN